MLSSNQVKEIIRFKLSRQRFKHSVQVADVARELARHYQLDEEKAYLIGLLHDYAKGIPGDELITIAEGNGLLENAVERLIPDLLHAPVGAWLLENELDINDPEIINAVKYHTLGSMTMSDMDKVIFLADMIEPGRDYPGREKLKSLALRNLDRAMLLGLDSTIRYCLDQNRVLHPRTIEVRNNYLKTIMKSEI